MTAYESFWTALDEGEIPVAFPVKDLENGGAGLSGCGVPFEGNAAAEELLYSEDWRDRAAAAVLALDFAMSTIELRYQGIAPDTT